MNPTQKFYDSYDKNNIVLKLTNSYYHNRNLELIRNRKNQFKEPKKSIHVRKEDPMVKYRIKRDNDELCGKIKEITNRKSSQFANNDYNSYKSRLALTKIKRRKEIQEEIDKENEEMFRRMGISKPFINTKQLDGDFEGEHKNIVKKLRRVDAEGTVVLPKIYTNPMLNRSPVNTENNKNDNEHLYVEKEEIDDKKHKSKETGNDDPNFASVEPEKTA